MTITIILTTNIHIITTVPAHSHHSRSLKDILALIEKSALAARVQERASKIFTDHRHGRSENPQHNARTDTFS